MDLTLYQQISDYIVDETIPSRFTEEQVKKLRAYSIHYIIKNGFLFKKNRRNPLEPLWVVKTSEKAKLLKKLHQDIYSGHFGINATYSRAAERYYWNNMYQDVKTFVQHCDSCQRRG
jgi:hypothetical protein